MDCQTISSILDERVRLHLSPAERCAVDRHLVACESCDAAWRAHEALAALEVPAAPPHLFERTLDFVAERSAAAPRRRLAPLLMLSATFAGAVAIAAVAVVRTPKHSGADLEPAQRSNALVYPSRQQAHDPDRIAVPIEPKKAPERDWIPTVRIPPEYPRRALQRGLEGWVRVEFTVTSTGAVTDAHVVASSNSVFEAATLASVGRWRFAPRLVDGMPVDVSGVQTTIRFQLSN